MATQGKDMWYDLINDKLKFFETELLKQINEIEFIQREVAKMKSLSNNFKETENQLNSSTKEDTQQSFNANIINYDFFGKSFQDILCKAQQNALNCSSTLQILKYSFIRLKMYIEAYKTKYSFKSAQLYICTKENDKICSSCNENRIISSPSVISEIDIFEQNQLFKKICEEIEVLKICLRNIHVKINECFSSYDGAFRDNCEYYKKIFMLNNNKFSAENVYLAFESFIEFHSKIQQEFLNLKNTLFSEKMTSVQDLDSNFMQVNENFNDVFKSKNSLLSMKAEDILLSDEKGDSFDAVLHEAFTKSSAKEAIAGISPSRTISIMSPKTDRLEDKLLYVQEELEMLQTKIINAVQLILDVEVEHHSSEDVISAVISVTEECTALRQEVSYLRKLRKEKKESWNKLRRFIIDIERKLEIKGRSVENLKEVVGELGHMIASSNSSSLDEMFLYLYSNQLEWLEKLTTGCENIGQDIPHQNYNKQKAFKSTEKNCKESSTQTSYLPTDHLKNVFHRTLKNKKEVTSFASEKEVKANHLPNSYTSGVTLDVVPEIQEELEQFDNILKENTTESHSKLKYASSNNNCVFEYLLDINNYFFNFVNNLKQKEKLFSEVINRNSGNAFEYENSSLVFPRHIYKKSLLIPSVSKKISKALLPNENVLLKNIVGTIMKEINNKSDLIIQNTASSDASYLHSLIYLVIASIYNPCFYKKDLLFPEQLSDLCTYVITSKLKNKLPKFLPWYKLCKNETNLSCDFVHKFCASMQSSFSSNNCVKMHEGNSFAICFSDSVFLPPILYPSECVKSEKLLLNRKSSAYEGKCESSETVSYPAADIKVTESINEKYDVNLPAILLSILDKEQQLKLNYMLFEVIFTSAKNNTSNSEVHTTKCAELEDTCGVSSVQCVTSFALLKFSDYEEESINYSNLNMQSVGQKICIFIANPINNSKYTVKKSGTFSDVSLEYLCEINEVLPLSCNVTSGIFHNQNVLLKPKMFLKLKLCNSDNSGLTNPIYEENIVKSEYSVSLNSPINFVNLDALNIEKTNICETTNSNEYKISSTNSFCSADVATQTDELYTDIEKSCYSDEVSVGQNIEKVSPCESDDSFYGSDKCNDMKLLQQEYTFRETSLLDEISALKDNLSQQNAVLQRLKEDGDTANQNLVEKENMLFELHNRIAELEEQLQESRKRNSKGIVTYDSKRCQTDIHGLEKYQDLKEIILVLRRANELSTEKLVDNTRLIKNLKMQLKTTITHLFSLKNAATAHLRKEKQHVLKVMQFKQQLHDADEIIGKQRFELEQNAELLALQELKIQGYEKKMNLMEEELNEKSVILLRSADSFGLKTDFGSQTDDMKMVNMCDTENGVSSNKQTELLLDIQGKLNQIQSHLLVEKDLSKKVAKFVQTKSCQSDNINQTYIWKLLSISEQSYLSLVLMLSDVLNIAKLKGCRSLRNMSSTDVKSILDTRKSDHKKIFQSLEKFKASVAAISSHDTSEQNYSSVSSHIPEKASNCSCNKNSFSKDKKMPLELKNAQILGLLSVEEQLKACGSKCKSYQV